MVYICVLEHLQKLNGRNIVYNQILYFLLNGFGKLSGWAIRMNAGTEADYKLHEGKNKAVLSLPCFYHSKKYADMKQF